MARPGTVGSDMDVPVKYHHNGGAEAILRPALVTVGGRCYRKYTDDGFGRRKGPFENDDGWFDRKVKPVCTTGKCRSYVYTQPWSFGLGHFNLIYCFMGQSLY